MTKLSEALARAHSAAKSHIIQSKDISRADRELLIRSRWLQPIVRGWYLLVRPDAPPGESSPWYASFWDFLALYLHDLYEDRYCLSAECSLDLQVHSTMVPKQVIAVAEKGNNSPLELPFNTTLLTYGDPANLPSEAVLVRGIRVMSIPLALCRVSPSYFVRNAEDAEIALKLVKDPSEFIRIILQYDFRRSVNRIIGAYEFLREKDMAASIRSALIEEHFTIHPENPFDEIKPLLPVQIQSPFTARIYSLWNSCRETVIQIFDPPSQLPEKSAYFSQLEKIYTEDAYNSLSIEGYRVNDELIKKVSNEGWNPDDDPQDRMTRDALAALGYHKAFLSVKESIGRILEGTSPAIEAKKNLHEWMRNLFQPMVQAHILRPEDLVGYRRSQVYIRGSRHIPFPREALLDSMEAFYDCLLNESHPAVRGILGHFLLVYIHPYMDGNGRTARFLMNAMFASGGYSWTIIRVDHRARYFSALESASINGEILPLAQFVLEEMRAF